MATNNLGSASVGIEIDLKALQTQLNTAAKMIGTMTKDANKGGSTSGLDGGMFAGLIAGARGAGAAIAEVGASGGTISSVGTAMGILDASLLEAGASAGKSGKMMTSMGVALGSTLAVVGIAVGVFMALKAAVNQAFAALYAAGNAQASNTAFENLVGNLGISTGKVNTFRSELEQMSFTASQQTDIMNNLTQALGANGLSSAALEGVKAMRDLSVAGQVTSQQGIATLTNALSTLDTTTLRGFGVQENASQLYEQYGATIGKTSAQLSVAEKQHAILNGVIAAGAANTGLADKASEDFNRVLTRLGSNVESLRAGIGQMFLPLASGVISMVNSEVLGLAKSVGENENKFKSMGVAIATAVLPMLRGFINWIKAIPWEKVANDIYVTANVFSSLGKVVLFVGQGIAAVMRVVGLTIASVGIIVKQVIGFFGALADTVANFLFMLFDSGNADTYMSNIGKSWADYGSSLANEWMAMYDQWDETFTDITSSMADTVGGAIGDMGDAMKGFSLSEFWNGLSGGLTDAEKEMLAGWDDTLEDMSAETLAAVQKMAEELSKENEDFARAQAKAAADYETQLAELTAQHRDRMADIRSDIAKEQKSYDKAYADRTLSYTDEMAKLSKADDDRKKDVNTQIAEELAKGRFADQTKLAALRARLVYEDATNKAAVKSAEDAYNEDITNLQTAHTEKLAELQTQLDVEIALKEKYEDDFAKYKDYIIADDITKLKESYKARAAEDLRAHQERLAAIIKSGAESAKAAGAAGTAEGNAYGAGVGGGIVDGLNKAKPEIRKAGEAAGYALYDALTNKLIGMGYDRPLKYQKDSNTWLPEFANGGIVGGKGGVDNNLAAVSRGEMILNNDQQRRMFDLLNGTMQVPGGGKASAGVVIQNMNVSLPSVTNANDFSRELQLKLVTMRGI